MEGTLDTRAAELLKLLIERYIQEGQPVASRTLARAAGLLLSSATIRNVMADLDEMGFVSSPHSSAGRVPTTRGYRYFVDSLLAPEPLSDAERARIAHELVPMPEQDLLEAASNLLSSLSHMAGVVTVPRRNLATLRRIEFLPLSDRRVLAILVVNQREVQNRVVSVDRDYGADELERFANAINQHFTGRELNRLRQALLDDMLATKRTVDQTLLQAASLAEQALSTEERRRQDYVLAGGSNLMAFQELSDVQRLRGLFEALDRKRELLQLFDQCLGADGVQIFIGDESGYQVLDECSVVTAPYEINGQVAGVLGVIGPTRMAYSRIIPLVSEAARQLSKGLKGER